MELLTPMLFEMVAVDGGGGELRRNDTLAIIITPTSDASKKNSYMLCHKLSFSDIGKNNVL